MDERNMKDILIETFNMVSDGYDSKALRFFPKSAEHMAQLLGLGGGEHVLDVACGTGHASLAIARRLSRGRVTAVDFSPGMLEQARRKASALGLRNIEFLERDMQDLRFPDGHFDTAVCAFGIFFVEDMDTQLRHIAAAVKPGGKVMITSFQESYFQPLRDRLFGRLASYGVQDPPQGWKRVSREAGCRELFEKAGFADIRVEAGNVGYFLGSAEEWWEIVWNAGFRRLVSRLSPQEQERFKGEHLQEIDELRTKTGIWLDAGVLFTMGTKPDGT